MTDQRILKMARVLAEYSLGLKPGQLVLLACEPPGFPLVREVYRLAVEAGAHPFVRTLYPELDRIYFEHAADEQLEYISEISRLETEKLDARLYVRALENLTELAGVDPKKRARASRARRELFDRYMERRASGELAASLTQYPTDGYAQQAGMSLAEYEDFVFAACFVDKDDPVGEWRALSAEQQRYVETLEPVSELKFESEGTDLTLSVKGRKWINSDGKANFPSGEVFTGPVEDSANGRIRFDVPTVYQGHRVQDVEFEFKDGKVVSAKAGQGEEFLLATLDTDEGSRFLGEVAFGLNYGITRATGSILFDEKIGGTIHMAVGAGYPHSGSTNKSSIHWDMIRSMKPGRVLADGKVVYEDGRFTG